MDSLFFKKRNRLSWTWSKFPGDQPKVLGIYKATNQAIFIQPISSEFQILIHVFENTRLKTIFKIFLWLRVSEIKAIFIHHSITLQDPR